MPVCLLETYGYDRFWLRQLQRIRDVLQLLWRKRFLLLVPLPFTHFHQAKGGEKMLKEHVSFASLAHHLLFIQRERACQSLRKQKIIVKLLLEQSKEPGPKRVFNEFLLHFCSQFFFKICPNFLLALTQNNGQNSEQNWYAWLPAMYSDCRRYPSDWSFHDKHVQSFLYHLICASIHHFLASASVPAQNVTCRGIGFFL